MKIKTKSYQENLNYAAKPKIFENARTLRKEMTLAERILWRYLRNRKLLGYKFRRQHPCYTFILDFYCHEAKLAVELDGSVHDISVQKERDEGRTYMIREAGIKVIRFANSEVEQDVNNVLNIIANHLSLQTHNKEK